MAKPLKEIEEEFRTLMNSFDFSIRGKYNPFEKSFDEFSDDFLKYLDEQKNCNGNGQKKPSYDDSKCRLGEKRIDELLCGGLPFRSNILLYGPKFTGKEAFLYSFAAEGLKNNTPVIYVTTGKPAFEVKGNLKKIIPEIDECEKAGLLNYVDIYSERMGNDISVEEILGNTLFVKDLTDFVHIEKYIEGIKETLGLGKQKYYRMVFDSVPPLLLSNKIDSTCKFIEKIASSCKKSNAVAVYNIDKGVHSDIDIEKIKQSMDGAIETKIDDTTTSLCVQGLDALSRSWIEYTFKNNSIELKGSFKVNHIK